MIEAVPDELESKIEIFTLLDKICKPQTILVSNTSALSVSEIASVTYRAAKIAGMRFADPVFSSKNLQIVRARLPMTKPLLRVLKSASAWANK